MSITTLKEKAARWVAKQAQRRAPQGGSNPFLEGAFAPVPEEITSTRLKVHGKIPEQLNGLLARIGPNPITPPNPGNYHWFTGDGMVHGLRLRHGEALWYRNRWVGTDRANKLLKRPQLEGPRVGIVDVVNTNIIGHAGNLWALVEAGTAPVEMDANLDSVRHGLFRSAARSGFTAHPHPDPATGCLHAVCYDALDQHRIKALTIDAAGQLQRRIDIPVKHGPMIHDCAVTSEALVILDLPVTFSLSRILKGASFPYQWNPRHPARVGLLPHQGSAAEICWYDVDPCYVFHTCNAFVDENGDTQVDVVVHERMFDSSIQGPESQRITFERWTLPRNGKRVLRRVISDKSQEFPRFDERLATRDYRYAYTVGADLGRPDLPQPLYRHDLKSGTTLQHDYGPHSVSGEAVFVPASAESAEDEGWLLSYVYNLEDDSSEVVILNAANIEGDAVARISLPARVPLGFHGNWIALDDQRGSG